MTIAKPNLLAVLLLLILSACQPSQPPQVATPLPSNSTSSPTPISSATVTIPPTSTPASSPIPSATATLAPTLLPGQVDVDQAALLIKKLTRSSDLPEEITPPDVWQRLGMQIFQVPLSNSVYGVTSLYVIKGGQAYLLGAVAKETGVDVEDFLVTDLDSNGSLELLFVVSEYSGKNPPTHVTSLLLDEQHLRRNTVLAAEEAIDIDLQKQDDQTVEVVIGGSGAEAGKRLGHVVAPAPDRLALQETPGVSAPGNYSDTELGINLQHPTSWTAARPGRWEGPDGFFELTRYESIASHVDFYAGGMDYRLTRACDWEVNLDPRRYGERPYVMREFHSPICIIKPGEGAEIPFPTAVLYAPTGGFAMLRADTDHFDNIVRSLTLNWPDDSWIWPDWPPISGTAPEQPVLETRQIGQLTADVYRLHKKAEVNLNADYMEMEKILGPVLDKNRARRKTWGSMDLPERAEWLTQKLAPFGYIAKYEEGNGLNLYQNETLAYENVFFWEPALAEVNGQVVDFAVALETPEGFQLAQKDGTIPWDIIDVKRWQTPVFLGDALLSVEIDPADPVNRIMLKKDDTVIYTYISSTPDGVEGEIDGLYAWEDRWVMVINGTLIIDGEMMNQRLGYGEIFGWQLLEGKPLYFFEKNGKIGINYDGQEQDLWFSHLMRDIHCGGCVLSVHGSDQLVWFWAWEDGAYYYVEVGK